MKTTHEHFELLHFTESRLGKPVVEDRTVRIPVVGLLPMVGHPLMTDGVRAISGVLVFHGVARSARALTEYIGDPKRPDGYKDEYLVEDLAPLTEPLRISRAYLFEGVYEEPVAWVNWDVLAEKFELETDG